MRKENAYRLDLGCCIIAYERMRAAIMTLDFDPVEMENSQLNLSENEEVILQGVALRDVLLRSFTDSEYDHNPKHTNHAQDPAETHYLPREELEHESHLNGLRGSGAFSENQFLQSWARRYQRHDPTVVEGDPDLSHLNRSQIRAMANMIGERISLVQGPPGTGKTKTIVETIRLLKSFFSVPHPILVCTYTNVAVDNLLEGFSAAGMKPIRVGVETSRNEELEHHMFGYQFDHHELKPQLDHVLEERKDVEVRIKGLSKDIENAVNAKGLRWKERTGRLF
jgi:hypothetical protein